MVRTIYQQLSPVEVHGQLDRVVEQLLEPFPQVAELLVGAVLAKQHDEWAEARRKGKSGGTEFAQQLLWNLGNVAQGVRRQHQVGVEGHGQATVTQPRGHRVDVQAALQPVAGTAVAQAVAARPFDTAVATVSKSAAAMPWEIHRAAVRGENRNTR